MTLFFPNPSRYYNAARGCVRFAGYDAVSEIAFDVEADALMRLDPSADATEASLLNVFDEYRGLIERTAKCQYLRTVANPYRLTAANFAAEQLQESRRTP
jgi:hypothetical protein